MVLKRESKRREILIGAVEPENLDIYLLCVCVLEDVSCLKCKWYNIIRLCCVAHLLICMLIIN